MRREVLDFAEAMEAKLVEHDDNRDWQNCELNYLLGRLLEEVAELATAVMPMGTRAIVLAECIRNTGNLFDNISWKVEDRRRFNDALGEAADVGNFAMMVADVFGRKLAEARKEARQP